MASRATVRPRILQAFITNGGVRVDAADIHSFLMVAEVEPSDVLVQRLLTRLVAQQQADLQQQLLTERQQLDRTGNTPSPRRVAPAAQGQPQVPIDDLVDLALGCMRASDHRQRGGDANYCLIQAWLACGGDEGCVAKIHRANLLKLTGTFGVVLDLPPLDEDENLFSGRGFPGLDSSAPSSHMGYSHPASPTTTGDISFSDFVEIVTASKELLTLAVKHSNGRGTRKSTKDEFAKSASNLTDEEKGEFLRSVIALAKLRRALRRCVLARRRRKALAAVAAGQQNLQPQQSRRMTVKNLSGRRHTKDAQPQVSGQRSARGGVPDRAAVAGGGGQSATRMPYVLNQSPRQQTYGTTFPLSTAHTAGQPGAAQSPTGGPAAVPQLSLFLTAAVSKSQGPLTPLAKLLSSYQSGEIGGGGDEGVSHRTNTTHGGGGGFGKSAEDVRASARLAALLDPIKRRNDLERRLQGLLGKTDPMQQQQQQHLAAAGRPTLPRIGVKMHDACTQVSEDSIVRETEAAGRQRRAAGLQQGPRELPRLRLLPLPLSSGRHLRKKKR